MVLVQGGTLEVNDGLAFGRTWPCDSPRLDLTSSVNVIKSSGSALVFWESL